MLRHQWLDVFKLLFLKDYLVDKLRDKNSWSLINIIWILSFPWTWNFDIEIEIGSCEFFRDYTQNSFWETALSMWYIFSTDDLLVTDRLWPFSPTCKHIKQSWLTETKNTGLFSLIGVFDKALFSEPSYFIRLQITVPKESFLPQPKPGALQRHQWQYLPMWGTSLIKQKRWMETNQIESSFGFSFLPVWVKSDARWKREAHWDSAVKIL